MPVYTYKVLPVNADGSLVFAPSGLAVQGVVGPAQAVGSTKPLLCGLEDFAGNLRSLRGLVDSTADGIGTGSPALWTAGPFHLFNNTSFERARSALAASGTTGTGLLGTGSLLWDGTRFWPWRGTDLGAAFVQGPITAGSGAGLSRPVLAGALDGGSSARFNYCHTSDNDDLGMLGYGLATNGYSHIFSRLSAGGAGGWDRTRATLSASGQTLGTGVLGTGPLLWDGTRHWPWRGDDNGAAYMQGPVANGAAIGNTRPLIAGLSDLSNNTGYLRGTQLSTTSFGTALNGLITIGVNYAARPDGNIEQCKTAHAASGTTGTGILAVANQLFDPETQRYQGERGHVGSHGNAWNNASTGASGQSNSVNCYGLGTITAFGNVAAATTIYLVFSANGTNWYTDDTKKAVIAGGSGGDFAIHADVGAQFVRLASSANVTATATIQGKR